MGKLIKNHLARLIVMTAAACKKSSSRFYMPALTRPRPNRSITTRFLLAKVLLGLPHHKLRLRRKTHPDPANRQPDIRRHRISLGMAAQAIRWDMATPIDRVAVTPTTAPGFDLDTHVSEHECGTVLSNRDGHLFLGL